MPLGQSCQRSHAGLVLISLLNALIFVFHIFEITGQEQTQRKNFKAAFLDSDWAGKERLQENLSNC